MNVQLGLAHAGSQPGRWLGRVVIALTAGTSFPCSVTTESSFRSSSLREASCVLALSRLMRQRIFEIKGEHKQDCSRAKRQTRAFGRAICGQRPSSIQRMTNGCWRLSVSGSVAEGARQCAAVCRGACQVSVQRGLPQRTVNVSAACRLGRWAVAFKPLDGDQAGTPGVVQTGVRTRTSPSSILNGSYNASADTRSPISRF